jgi:hypothetical protein
MALPMVIVRSRPSLTAAIPLYTGVKMLIELADPSHKILASETVSVSVPEPKASSELHAH